MLEKKNDTNYRRFKSDDAVLPNLISIAMDYTEKANQCNMSGKREDPKTWSDIIKASVF